MAARLEKQDPWIGIAPAQTLQASLKDLHQGFKGLFSKRTKFPKFKKKGQSASFRFPQGATLDEANARIKLPKLGWIRYRKSRDVIGKIKNVTCSYKAGKWFVSIQTEMEVVKPLPLGLSAVGVDLGVTNFATLSDGTFIKPKNSFKKHEQRFKKYQRRMSRQVKGSKNYKKTRAKLARCHQTLANVRKDFLHKASTEIANNHALVVIEDLKVKNMTKAGKHKRGLNKAILDQGWAEFRRQLEYKLAWNGGMLVVVNPAYTSQTCSVCGHVHKDNRTSQSNFMCVACGHHEHADLNAAKNILAAGHAVLACGGPVSQPTPCASVASPMKQEPNEEIGDHLVDDLVGIPVL